ncbi:hypothetical protein NE237_025329 [Protea cynaroides]|uniref:Uncharacterized protein n=1 Tax=Protea cynaroides TaxID=273540 RepID=A0A9Q0K1N2_9MAGN|nr:hypothetical protein NE237_025329 [Protea cynaroides]
MILSLAGIVAEMGFVRNAEEIGLKERWSTGNGYAETCERDGKQGGRNKFMEPPSLYCFIDLHQAGNRLWDKRIGAVVSSYILAGALPSQQFGIVQGKIYPVKSMAGAWQ